MRIMITGGAGFIGANFIHHWMEQHPDDEVVNYDLLTYAGNLENLKAVEENPRYHFVYGDIRNRDDVREAMKNCEVVVHFAAESHVDRSILNPSDFVTTNVVGTQVLLDVARELGVRRFHHVSTDEVFGSLELESAELFSETTPYNPHSPYSASKAGSDHLVRAYADTFGLPITITNCSNNYGPFHFPEKFIPLAITNILEGKKVPLYGDGKNVRDWLYVTDHCRAIETVILHGAVGETYCVGGSDDHISNLDIIQKLLELLGKTDESIEFVADRPGHDRRYAIDSSKIARELGWKPLETLDSGLAKTVAWYQANRQWWERVKSGAYQDYYQQQYGTREGGI